MSNGKDAKPEQAVARILKSATRLAVLPPESPLALSDVFTVLEQLGFLARKTIQIEFPAEYSVDEIEGRYNWMKATFFLAATNLFPGINDLLLALSDLDRGRQLSSLKPLLTGKGSGSRTTHQELAVQRRAVEAGARIVALCSKDAECDERLRARGTSQWTLDGYRRSCENAAPIYWIESSAYSELSLYEAEVVLGLQIIQLKQLRCNRQKRAKAK